MDSPAASNKVASGATSMSIKRHLSDEQKIMAKNMTT